MAKPTVLVVEDDPDIVELLVYNLQREGFVVYAVSDGEKGLTMALRKRPDLVLLDLMLPGMDGLEVCRRLRSEDDGAHLPVIMLTAKGEETDVVLGLELGADDYITKPFSIREFRSRVRALLRRATTAVPAEEEQAIDTDGLRIDLARRDVEAYGKPVQLTYVEFELLRTLAAHPGRVYTREMLLQAVWGGSDYREPRTIDVHVRHLREKLERDPRAPEFILTVRGVGYRFRR